VVCIASKLYAEHERAIGVDFSVRECVCALQPHADGRTEGWYSEESTLVQPPAPPFVH
jgi:hypothetical protein